MSLLPSKHFFKSESQIMLAEIFVSAFVSNMYQVSGWSFTLPKTKFVHGHRKVARLAEAHVGIVVVHWDDVYITEHETVVIVFLYCLCVSHIEQFCPVECALPSLNKQKKQRYHDIMTCVAKNSKHMCPEAPLLTDAMQMDVM